MTNIKSLKPIELWRYFEEICNIPRLSKNEIKIRQYLINFAALNNLEAKEDSVGNILITKQASPGFENRKTVVLQSHMDMVGEKNADHPHDWAKDPIIPVVKGEWVVASGTTLGADDGIGIASQMAILTDKNLKAGKIECLFTVDEETGMTGAVNLKPDFFTGRTLLNLDSEDEGILFIGCAGGMDSVGIIQYKTEQTEINCGALIISVTGLHGGHSGDEIHKGYGNAVKIMAQLLKYITDECDSSIAVFNGGNLRNAIPREAFSTITYEQKSGNTIKILTEKFARNAAVELGELEKEMKITVLDTEVPSQVMDKESQTRFLKALNDCPHGVIAWSKDMDDLVETSTNLASAKFSENNTIKIVTTQRSSIEASKHETAELIDSCLRNAGAIVVHSDGYPGWKPDINSPILKTTRNSYLKLFGKEPQIRAIHAGLECGLFYEKISGIDMISFGPTIRGAHTPEEMIEIKTVQMYWDLLIDVIVNMPAER